jgi:hypothetical protein
LRPVRFGSVNTVPYARGQACKRESMLKGSKFGEIMN